MLSLRPILNKFGSKKFYIEKRPIKIGDETIMSDTDTGQEWTDRREELATKSYEELQRMITILQEEIECIQEALEYKEFEEMA